MIGKTLNHYRIVEKIGAGGMGEVYVAEDAKLSRRVALKVLPAEFAASADRLGRFEREAKAVAALNHPNIVTIYSIERSDPGDGSQINFLTMELVSGKTLTQIIPRQGMMLGPLFEIGLALADAIGSAHAKGIVHRDLKPANIMIDDAGRVKVLDFGLARIEAGPAGTLDTATATRDLATEEGKILGTVAYMSPEQAEGKPVDARSDIFSLGVLLYEMATGTRPFKGDTKISVISSIIRETPTSITDLNDNLPRHFGRIVKRCLAKESKRRYPDARELHNELLELKEELDSGELQPMAAAVHRGRTGTPGLYVVGGMILLGLIAASYLAFEARRRAAAPGAGAAPIEATVTQLTDSPGLELHPNLSPDGRTVLYVSETSGSRNIFLQRVEGERVFNLTEGSGSDNLSPAWSPDGEEIAFNSTRDGGGIFLMGGMGESVRRLTDVGFFPAWSPDGSRIVYCTKSFEDPKLVLSDSELWTVEVRTGQKTNIQAAGAMQPNWSPNGQRIAYWGLRPGSGQRDIWTIPAAGGQAISITDDLSTEWNPVWSPDGRFLYFISDRSGSMNLWRISIDEKTGEVRGSARPVTSGSSEIGFFSMAGDGQRIAYQVFNGSSNIQKIGFDPDTGSIVGELEWVTRGNRNIVVPAVSPDGEWVAYTLWGSQEDLYVMRADGTDRRRLTDDMHKNRLPRWSPEGDRLAFFSDRSGDYEIWTIRPDGSDLQQMTDTPGRNTVGVCWSPDGTRVATRIGNRIHLIDPRLSLSEQIYQPLPDWPEGGDRVFQPFDWSPDSRRLAGIIIRQDGGYDGFWVYSTEREEFTRLTGPDERLRGEVLGPFWIDNERKFLFSAKSEMYFLDGGTGRYEEILSVEPDLLYLSDATADRRTLYLDRATYESDIWMLELQ